jgi:hypothetical protein
MLDAKVPKTGYAVAQHPKDDLGGAAVKMEKWGSEEWAAGV